MSMDYPTIPLKNVQPFVVSKESNTRRKLWQLHGSCHCLIIGTCLKLSEVKSICKKAGYPVQGKSDYDLHRFVVGQSSHADSEIARRAQKMLDTRFKVDVTRLRGWPPSALMPLGIRAFEYWHRYKDRRDGVIAPIAYR